MRITDCRADWTENKNFCLPISAGGNQYIFIHFLSRAKLHTSYCDVSIPSGACILFDKHAPMHISFPGKAARFGWFFLQGDLNEQIKKYEVKFNQIYYPNNTDITQILRCIEKSLLAKHPFLKDLCACKVCELMLALTQGTRKPQPLIYSHTNLEKLRVAMTYDSARKWTTAQMCARSDLSINTLAKHYKQIYCVSPKEDLAIMRIQHAKFMLLTQKLTIKEIAHHCGFSSASSFSKCFKLHTGVLPSIYIHSL